MKKLFSQERKILYFSEVSAFFFSGCCGSLLLHKGFALVAESRGCSLVGVRGLLSMLAEKPTFLSLQSTGSKTLGLQELQHAAW